MKPAQWVERRLQLDGGWLHYHLRYSMITTMVYTWMSTMGGQDQFIAYFS